MFNNDRHLNLFEHYTQKESLPIENNVTRGLAILLNQNSLVLDRFIDYINAKRTDKKTLFPILKPQKPDDREIGIQQNITKIVQNCPNPQNIIGLTLTTSYQISMLENKIDDKTSLIVDIAIVCKDTLIIIEIKRNANDARAQLKQQVKSVAAEVVKQGGNLPDTELLESTWEEIIPILQDVYNISGRNNNSILAHYLNHLENHYQQWFPVSLLSDILINSDNESAVNKRIMNLIKNCCNNESDSEKYLGRYVIPLEYGFCTEAQIRMDYETKTLIITVWSGDTKGQGSYLFNKTTNSLSWVYEDSLYINDELKLKVLTSPYLRLAHFQSTVFNEYFDKEYYREHFGISKDKCIALYNDIAREWKKAEWNDLKSLLKNRYSSLINMDTFEASFSSNFENSNRNYVHVSFGYETNIYIPSSVIYKYEKNSSTLKGKDKLAELVSNIIDLIMSKIA